MQEIGQPPVAPAQRVTVVDLDIPFTSLVNFILLCTLATIPTLLILGFFGLLLSVIFVNIFH
jgi:hypothetical protein